MACLRSSATSVISTMKVDWPPARSSLAPMRVKIRSTTPMWADRAGTKGAHLGHEDHKGHLAHVGGLARHVGAGDDGRPVVLAVHVGVVGDKEAVLQHLLHHRVAALGDLQFVRVVHQGHAVVVLRRHQGEGRQHVGLGHGPGDLLDLGGLGGGLVPDLTEELVPRATIRSWAERMVCSMSLSSWVMYRSQLTRVCFRMYSGNLVVVGLGDLDVVAKDFIEAHLWDLIPVFSFSAASSLAMTPLVSVSSSRTWSTSGWYPGRMRPPSRTEKGGSSTMPRAMRGGEPGRPSMSWRTLARREGALSGKWFCSRGSRSSPAARATRSRAPAVP